MAINNSAAPAISMCVISSVASPGASGTSNCCGGSIDLTLPLTTSLYLTGDTQPLMADIQPCPLCSGGTCVGGINNNGPCVPGTTALNPAYPTSQDCPPDPTTLVATLPFTPLLTTGTVSRTATVATNDDGTGFDQQRVFCGYCRDATGTGTFESPAHQCWDNGMAVGAACAGVYETCEQRAQGAFGPNGGVVKTITAFGQTAPGICNPADAHLATAVCVPPTFSPTVDAGYDLPAPAASVVSFTTQFCAAANPCP
jgi:hypothetical protein